MHQRSGALRARGDHGLSALKPFAIGQLASAESSAMDLPFLPTIGGQTKRFPRQVVSGTGIDEVYDKSQNILLKLKDENRQLAVENAQLK